MCAQNNFYNKVTMAKCLDCCLDEILASQSQFAKKKKKNIMKPISAVFGKTQDCISRAPFILT